MNTPFFANPAHFATLRRLCIKLNRILAWAMLATPFTLVMSKLEFDVWLDVQFTLLLAHGAMSLLLFGIPKLKGRKFVFSMHVLGMRLGGLGPRHTFLFNGYRIALGLLAYFIFSIDLIGGLGLLLIYPFLRLPFSYSQHLLTAFEYALQRWGWRSVKGATLLKTYFWMLLLVCSLHSALKG